MIKLKISFHTRNGVISREHMLNKFDKSEIKKHVDELLEYMGYLGVRDSSEIVDRDLTILNNGNIFVQFS